MSFQVSDKVVCVSRFTSDCSPANKVPQPGEMFVVRGLSGPDRDGTLGLLLVGVYSNEMALRLDGNLEEAGWWVRRFRLLSEVQAENRIKATQEATA